MTPDPQNSNAAPKPVTLEVVREQDKIMLVLSYIGILALIPLITVKDSPFVKFHAAQGTALTIVMFGLSFILPMIPVLGWLGLCVIFPGWLVVTIMGIVKALKGERWEIPGVGALGQKMFGN